MQKERKPVPKEIETKIKVEAGHKCTIWSCTENYPLEKHHIDGNPTNNNEDNIIYLCANHHKMADDGKITQEECHLYKKLLKDKLEGNIHIKEQPSEAKGKEVEPERFFERAIFSLGKRYVLWRHGDLQVDLTKDYITFGIIGLLLLSPTLFLIGIVKLIGQSSAFYMLSVISATLGIIIIASIVTIANSRCPNCKKNFGIRRVKSFETGRTKLEKTDYGTRYEVTYDNTYKCEFCGHSYHRMERETETI
jgi:hypothetical protein